MKIGFVLDDTLDRPDGVQQYVLTLGRWLTGQSHEVHYLVGESERKDLAHLHSLARNVRVSFNRNRMAVPLPVSKKRLRSLLNEQQYDVLHVQVPYSPFFAGRVISAAPQETAVVGTFHVLPYSRIERAAGYALSRMTKSSLRCIERCMSVSDPAAQFARQAFDLSCKTVPISINQTSFKNAKPFKKYEKNFTIVFLGRLVERKGTLQLVRAVAHNADFLRKHHVKVVLCGSGPLKERIAQFLRHHDLEDLVEMTGFMKENQKPRYLASADIAVFPSLSGESFGIVLLEAMAAGAGCVLAGKNPGYSSVFASVPEALFEPRNTRAFAATLEDFISDKNKRDKLHKAQQQLISRFDIDFVGEEVLNEYKTTIAKRT